MITSNVTIGSTIVTPTAIATHPTTGALYVVVLNGANQQLGTINAMTGAVTNIGTISSAPATIRTMTFDASARLWATATSNVTFTEASPANVTIGRISLTSPAFTSLLTRPAAPNRSPDCLFRPGGSGGFSNDYETLVFNPNNGRLYRFGAGLEEININNISAPTLASSTGFSQGLYHIRGAVWGWPVANQIGFVTTYHCDTPFNGGPNHDRWTVTTGGVITKVITGLADASNLALVNLGTSYIENNCTNGVDDNGSGGTDCNDRSCRGVLPCSEHACIDSNDNDGDGSEDCSDQDCRGVGGCG